MIKRELLKIIEYEVDDDERNAVEKRFFQVKGYWDAIERLKKTPLYADGRYAAAVNDFKAELGRGTKKEDIDVVKIARRHFMPEYETLSFMKKAELLTNIQHMRVDTIAGRP